VDTNLRVPEDGILGPHNQAALDGVQRTLTEGEENEPQVLAVNTGLSPCHDVNAKHRRGCGNCGNYQKMCQQCHWYGGEKRRLKPYSKCPPVEFCSHILFAASELDFLLPRRAGLATPDIDAE